MWTIASRFSSVIRIIMLAAIFSSGAMAADVDELKSVYVPKLARNLENIVRFWHPACLDHVNGGYFVNFDASGAKLPEQPKMIVTQARMLWFFSRLARDGRPEHLKSAALGFRFLTEKMWDHEFGGFYWEVDVTGKEKVRPKKHLYGQSFALYALSEYYLASGREDVLRFATRLFNLLEEKSHDAEYGGYIEFFNRDWSRPSAEEISYMGEPEMKLMNTHLHLLESVTAYYRASNRMIARERLLELITIQSNSVVRKDLGACTDKYERDWTPRLDSGYARVSYGHDLENIWLLIDACRAADISVPPLMDLFRTLWRYSVRYGYDTGEGGFYDSGLFNQPADRRQKVWWVQAEVIVAALYLYQVTGDPEYRRIFEKTYEFIETKMTDWQNGEWHEQIYPDGRVDAVKGHRWKAAYHNGRAMIECLKVLRNE